MSIVHQEYPTCMLDVEENGVAVLTMTDERRMNPFNEETLKNITQAMTLLKNTPEAQVLILTGVGYAFSSGGDIKLLSSMENVHHAKEIFDAASFGVNLFYELEIPVIAAVNGIVAGAALAMMLACDLIIGSENASLFFSFRQIAFTPDSGTSYFLTRRLGYYKAAEILFFGSNIDAAQAAELGLFNKVVPADTLLSEARKWGERIVRGPMMTIGYDKKLLRAAMHNTVYEQQELEALYQVLTWSSEDFREGVSAFTARRRPGFRGKWKLKGLL